MARIVRDPESKEVLQVTESGARTSRPQRSAERGLGKYVGPVSAPSDVPEGAEVIEKPSRTMMGVMAELEWAAGGPPGKMRYQDDGTLEADPPEAEPASELDELLDLVKSRKASEPVTRADIEQAAAHVRQKRERGQL